MTSLFSCGLIHCSLGYVPTEAVLDKNQFFQNVLVQVDFIRNRSFRQRVLCVQVPIEVMRFQLCLLHNRQPHAPMKSFHYQDLTCMKFEYELVIIVYIRSQNQNLKLERSKNRGDRSQILILDSRFIIY